MDIFEEFVMWDLAGRRGLFISPEYELRGPGGTWSRPDFVALDFRSKQVIIVEVSVAASPRGLLARVRDREKQWYARLEDQLRKGNVIDDSWGAFKVELYTRDQAKAIFERELQGKKDVEICTLEKFGLPWQRDWSAKAKKEVEEQ